MNNWTKRWNDRYSNDEFAYGEEPNNYLKEQIEKLEIGTILFPAEGEGRNAIFAAKSGWKVSAFDISEEGKNKALKLAKANNVSIDYQVGELETLDFEEGQLAVRGQKFKDASIFYNSVSEINADDLKRWLQKSETIQWDYKNLIKRKGVLVRLK